jgi:uncharacterized membrane protein
MTLSPEERKKIYEEEKARIENEKAQQQGETTSTLDLKPGTAGLLCYLGGWISGIIFLVLEQKNRLVRFHAMQSIIVFGSLSIIGALLGQIPFIGLFFAPAVGILAFVLWIVLMVKASQGYFSLPIAGELAEKILGPTPQTTGSQTTTPSPAAPPQPVVMEPARKAARGDRGRAGRMVASAFAIAFSIALLIFFNFFHDYLAYYHLETIGNASVWIREPFVTSDFSLWLPIVNTALTLNIIGHVILLVIDKYILREGTLLVLDVFSLVSMAALLVIFPFDFGVFGSNIAGPIELSVRITFALIIFGICIGILVRGIRILVNVIRGTATYR